MEYTKDYSIKCVLFSQETSFMKSDKMLCDFDVNEIIFHYLCSSLV